MGERWKPGTRVRWRHHCRGRGSVERTGVVFSLAPRTEEADEVAWVLPDEPLPGDGYRLLAVEWVRGDPAARSSDDPGSPTGALVVAARRAALDVRRAALRTRLANRNTTG